MDGTLQKCFIITSVKEVMFQPVFILYYSSKSQYVGKLPAWLRSALNALVVYIYLLGVLSGSDQSGDAWTADGSISPPSLVPPDKGADW